MLLLTGFILFSSTDIAAQQVTPPSRVNVKFNAKYPQQADKANWQQTKDGYTATFNAQGRRTVSRFTEDGQWVDTQTQLLQKDLQPPMRKYMDDNHKGYRYLQGYHFENPKESRYQLDVQNTEGLRYRLDFDKEGNFVNEGPIE